METILETDQESNYMTTNRTMAQVAANQNDRSFTNMDFAQKLQKSNEKNQNSASSSDFASDL